MSYKDHLEKQIRTSYRIIREREEIIITSPRPEEKLESERAIERQWELIRACLTKYIPFCRRQEIPLPDDIHEIAAHFPRLPDSGDVKVIADGLGQVSVALRQVIPEGETALDWFTLSLQELGHHHEVLNEWKELHNLLQEAVTSLAPFVGELELTLSTGDPWNAISGRRLWRPTRTQLGKLQAFARGIRHIDEQFCDDLDSWRGPEWMMEISILQRHMDAGLREGDVSAIYELATSLLDSCSTYLYVADKQLRESVGELCLLSNNIIRSVER